MGFMKTLNNDDANSGCPAGRIQVGEKTERGFPKSLDYFKASGNYIENFKAAYGENPKSIEIMFTKNENDIDERFQCFDKAGKQIRKTRDITDFLLPIEWHGDPDFEEFARSGVSWIAFQTEKGYLGVIQDGKFYCYFQDEWKQYTYSPELVKNRPFVTWKRILELRFRLPLVQGIDGLWIFEAKGITSIDPLRNSIQTYQEMYGDFFYKTPFDLNVAIQEGSGGRRYPVVSIIPNFAKIEKLMETSFYSMAKPKQLGAGEATSQLRLGDPDAVQTLEVEYNDELNEALRKELEHE